MAKTTRPMKKNKSQGFEHFARLEKLGLFTEDNGGENTKNKHTSNALDNYGYLKNIGFEIVK